MNTIGQIILMLLITISMLACTMLECPAPSASDITALAPAPAAATVQAPAHR